MFRIVLLTLCFAGIALGQGPSAYDADLTKKIDVIIKDWMKLKPGMTRAELEKVVQGEGGLYGPGERSYAWPNCPYIKVDVKFNTAPYQLKELSTDTIKSISKPFLEYAITD